ncbi:hypothetical protein [Ornithinibacillus scapharcae]|uniref:hypothetical protein n=1 Tax=Ornithinibacillus scapharcae TaxID=1147159 RepID=UPI000225B385|nr:hypothetical protein [Ornithinibacillus scapharcae]
MRALVIITTIVAGISMIYKWRYKLMNAILAVSFLRRMAVSISMNMPSIRNKILPSIFKQETSSTN